MSTYLLAIDQGTTGSTALVVSGDGRTLGRATVEFPQHFPQPGWVSHDVEEIWQSVGEAVQQALAIAGVKSADIAAIGITNQRETTVVWDRKSGKAVAPAIVWQCRRTAETCAALKKDPKIVDRVRAKTGLVIDAYFSATKVAFILDHTPGLRDRAERGELAFGTIDSYLVHRLTGGEVHVTDVTNASRTLLLNLHTSQWDEELAALFRVPMAVLPRITGCAEIVARTRAAGILPDGIPIAGMAGDQHAALFGQACFEVGDAKCTYGTGAFALMNIGPTPKLSTHGLVTTVAWRIGDVTTYALEGSTFIAGAAVQWLRDGLGIIGKASEVEALARTVDGSGGVVFVPALSGLGAPYWDQDARGTIVGITRGTNRAHLARATLDGIAFQVEGLLKAMAADAGSIARLRVDGGACANDLLMQIQADLSSVVVERPKEIESTGRGAAMLAAIGVGFHKGLGSVREMWTLDRSFQPAIRPEERKKRLDAFADAVRRTRSSF